jgi:hypothetical protein
MTLSTKFIVKMLYEVIRLSKQKSLGLVTIRNSFNDIYLNYLDGLTWCLDTYKTGKCKRYDYMYEYQESPHPLGLIMNMLENNELLKLNKCEFPPIDPSLYAILVLPNYAKKLINKKYYKFMESSDILYATEKCEKCSDFYKQIKVLKCDIAQTEAELDSDSEETNQKTKKKIKELRDNNTIVSKKLIAHKKNHDKLTLSDIKELINKFKQFN